MVLGGVCTTIIDLYSKAMEEVSTRLPLLFLLAALLIVIAANICRIHSFQMEFIHIVVMVLLGKYVYSIVVNYLS